MTNSELRDLQLPYIADEKVFEEQKCARILTQQLNSADRSDFKKIAEIVKKLFARVGENAVVNPPFFCDYGAHIEVGKNFFANYDCTILDVAKVKIGDDCFFAPNVAIYTAGHPIHPKARAAKFEYGIEISIGNNVWIGGNSVVCPGVKIGNNVVIGAGSVVTRDVPDDCVAAGNPCRVLRKITERDLEFYFRERRFSAEVLEQIHAGTTNSAGTSSGTEL